MTHDHPLRGAGLVLVSSLAFASMGALVKHIAPMLPNEMLVFFRNLFGLIALMPFVYRFGIAQLRTENLRWHLSRALFGVTAMYCFFYALGHMPLADALLLNYTAPVFTPLIAAWWLRERLTRQLVWAAAIGLIGVMVILKPGHELFAPVALIGLASGFFAALAMSTIRRMAQTEPAVRIVFYFGVVATLVSAVPLLWAWQTPDVTTTLLLMGSGVLATVGQLFLTKAYSRAPAARVGPLTYATVIFAAIYGWMWWAETPDLWSLTGALLVALGGALSMRRQPLEKV
jgi:drug/metabolite transporter (DMT)-like permease